MTKYYIAEIINGDIYQYHGINHKKGYIKGFAETAQPDPDIYFDTKSEAESRALMLSIDGCNFLDTEAGIKRTFEVIGIK